MSGRRGWDHAARELLKEWKRVPTPTNMRLGQCVLHVPSQTWYLFGDFVEGQLVATDGGEGVMVDEPSSFKRGWDPDIDPEEFEEALRRRKAENRASR